MGLLDLPQELLDHIGEDSHALDLIAVRATSKQLYRCLGGDRRLRQALADLETHWASESHVKWTLKRLPKDSTRTWYPPYRDFLRRAPCYTCLRISTPQNTCLYDERFLRDGRQVFMLPWSGFGGFDRSQFNKVNLERQCIDCVIEDAKRNGVKQQCHRAYTEQPSFKFRCRQCDVLHVTTRDSVYYFPRFEKSCLCQSCFDRLNVGWHPFRFRLQVRLRRIQQYYEHLRLRLDPDVLYRGRAGVGPLPPRDDVHEDAALWQPVLDGPLLFDIHVRREAFLQAVVSMNRYMFWMQMLDVGRICKHRVTPPPSMETVAQLGPWPQWEQVLQHIAETAETWELVRCVTCLEEMSTRQAKPDRI